MKLLSRIKARVDTGQNLPVVVFPHIPKTAGQTVIAALQRIFPEQTFSPVRTHSAAPPDAQMPPGYKLYAGHIDWTDIETLPETRFAFTLLRDPRERIASFYFYLLREAAKLTPDELATKQRTNMRMISTRSADDYFFGGNQQWQRFVHDHYDNFYCNYFITRKIRGWKDVKNLGHDALFDRALQGAAQLQKVYALDQLDTLEDDLEDVLGTRPKVSGTYVNAGPDAGTAQRWSYLLARFESDASAVKLDAFAQADAALMRKLGLG